jgi:hypothetical protein
MQWLVACGSKESGGTVANRRECMQRSEGLSLRDDPKVTSLIFVPIITRSGDGY